MVDQNFCLFKMFKRFGTMFLPCFLIDTQKVKPFTKFNSLNSDLTEIKGKLYWNQNQNYMNDTCNRIQSHKTALSNR